MHKVALPFTGCALALLAAGCDHGEPPGEVGDGADAAVAPASDAGATDADTAACPTALDHGAAVLISQRASGEGAANARANLDAIGDIDGAGQRDQINVLMYSNTGAFGETLPTGTFELSGIESDFATCGLCVMLYADVGATIDDVYMPVAGSIAITRYDPTFRAALTEVSFRHVLIDASTFATSAHPDGCTSRVRAAAFDVPIINGAK